MLAEKMCVPAREIAQCRCVSKGKWREEHAFNLCLREGMCVFACFLMGLLCIQIDECVHM